MYRYKIAQQALTADVIDTDGYYLLPLRIIAVQSADKYPTL